MRYQVLVQAAAGVLSTALLAGTAFAQSQPLPQPRTMTDTAPLPASDRSSVGAVILMDEPVLAQREEMLQAQERHDVDTRAMGAGPARLLRGLPMEEQPRQDTQKNRPTPK